MAQANIEAVESAQNFKRNKSNKWKDIPFVISLLIYPVILFLVFYVYVNLNSFVLAFKKYEYDDSWTWIGFENFTWFIQQISGENGSWAKAFGNSIKTYFICLFTTLPLYILLSYILFKKCFLNKTIRTIVMIPQIISGFIMCLVFRRFLENALPDFFVSTFGLDSFPELLKDAKYSYGVTLGYTIWVSFSTSLIVYPNAMNEIDESIIEAGYLDGVGNIFRELWSIIIPNIFPTVSTFIILGITTIFTNPGAVPTFYMYSAPVETHNIGYLFWERIANTTNFIGYPGLAAGGIIMTAVIAPITLVVRWLLEKYGPNPEY